MLAGGRESGMEGASPAWRVWRDRTRGVSGGGRIHLLAEEFREFAVPVTRVRRTNEDSADCLFGTAGVADDLGHRTSAPGGH